MEGVPFRGANGCFLRSIHGTLFFHIRSGGDFGAEPRGEKAPGARRFVAQNGFCSTKTHLARPLGRVSEKKVRLPKVFQFGGKIRVALFVGKTFVFNRE